jgi:hypothetical protein
VAILRANHAIPVYRPPAQPDVGPHDEDVVVAAITEAEKILRVSKVTSTGGSDGFINAEQSTPGAPWRIRIDQALRDRIQPEAPEGWLSLDEAAKALGVPAKWSTAPTARRLRASPGVWTNARSG